MGTKEAALQGADALVICTEWKNFRAPNFELIKEKLNTNALFDGRNMFEPSRMAEKGFAYYCIGRGLSITANVSENNL
jgi:UDPglucose 6-dehydrogenase